MCDVAGSIGSVVSPVLEVGKWLVVPISHQFKYLFNYNTNFKNLEKEVKKLKNTKEEVHDQVDAAERNLGKIKQNVKDWQNDVEKAITKVEQLIQEKADNQRYSKGLCCNFIIHYKHSKKAFKLKRDNVDPLLQQGKELGPVSSRTNPLLEIWLRSSEDYLAFESRNSTMKNVWDALIDENVFMTGVYGMGGIGKTTLVQELGRKAKMDQLFEDIVFVEVSESPDIKKIQTAIADNLGLKFENESERAKALYSRMEGNVIQTRELYSLPNDVCKECGGLPIVISIIAKALKNKSRLSDWKYALQELRAPSPAKFTGFLEKDYTKIALSYKYLRDDELKKTFLISSLMKNNTSILDLFKHVVCLDILGGVNLTMEDARDRLDKLVDDLKDACLLLNGVESEQFAMHDLVRAIATTIAYVDHHVFTMRNDVERDWKDRDKLKKCTKISLPGNNTIISQLLPSDLDCPDLEYFSVSNMSNPSFEILKDSFTMLSKLKVLNLVELQQLSLPSSIIVLTNLQTLCLDNSEIKDFAIIGKLETLKVLSLQELDIEVFPLELGQLTQLRLLDLSDCRQLKVITPNVISQLSKLEEFYIKGCPIKWKHEVLKELKLLSNLTSLELDIEDNNVLPKDFISKELRRYKITIGYEYYEDPRSKYLRILEIACNSPISQEELYGINNVEVLRIVKSLDDEEDLDKKQMLPLFNEKVIFTNLMVLKLVNISFGRIWKSQLSTFSFQNLTQMMLVKCDKIKHVFPFSIAKSLEQLQYLMIKDCKVLDKNVEKERTEVVNFIFPRITKLELTDLPKLTIFYQGTDALELPILKTLKIVRCPNFTLRCQSFQDNNEDGEIQDSESKSIFFGQKILSYSS
ncbi:probable disease resistance protein At1g61310 [Mangifera indica]|uniref:probable disease resistance protein At1g61310 n=1 Tax=Mangifera indica TaxID=29780 RepID=UPI001CFBAEDE|nr:probable disease resistance protein At1g61310 [Mangifera indica]